LHDFGSLIKSLLGNIGSGTGLASEFDKASPGIGAAGNLDTTSGQSTLNNLFMNKPNH
jgi:hypothetical protein